MPSLKSCLRGKSPLDQLEEDDSLFSRFEAPRRRKEHACHQPNAPDPKHNGREPRAPASRHPFSSNIGPVQKRPQGRNGDRDATQQQPERRERVDPDGPLRGRKRQVIRPSARLL
jgi:hypothetical protein